MPRLALPRSARSRVVASLLVATVAAVMLGIRLVPMVADAESRAAAADSAASATASAGAATPAQAPQVAPSAEPVATLTGACPAADVTTPFVPPAPYPAIAPGIRRVWLGTSDLWTTVVAADSRATLMGLQQKTFFWSQHFDVTKERQPALAIEARRLDGPGTAAGDSPATHGWVSADAPFMLTGLELPSYGCWEIQARYKGYALTFVVEVVPP